MHVGDSAIVGHVARGIASFALRDKGELADASLDEDTWSELLAVVRNQRLGGLLRSVVRSGYLPVTEDQEQATRALDRNLAFEVLALEQLLVSAWHELTRHSIEARVLKGAAHARLLYADPAERPYVDVDLLVRGRDFGHAVAVLHGLSIVRTTPELRPGFDERFGKGATLRTAGGLGVDLHRTFVSGPFAATVAADSLFTRSREIDVGGQRLSALGAEELLIHACFHAVLSDFEPRLISYRDVVLATLEAGLDVGRLRSLAEEWRASAALALGVRRSWLVLQPLASNELVDWSFSYEPSRREQRTLSAYQRADHRWAHQAVAALPVIHGWRAKAAYVRAISASQRKRSSRL